MRSEYANGQKVFEQEGDILTYFYKNGKIKARGISINGKMQGEWIFYRETLAHFIIARIMCQLDEAE